jgi:hypothetical protein
MDDTLINGLKLVNQEQKNKRQKIDIIQNNKTEKKDELNESIHKTIMTNNNNNIGYKKK